MPFDFAEAFTAFGEAVNSGFSYAERCKEQQSETELIKDWKRQSKAIDTAEKIIALLGQYHMLLSKKDQRKFKSLFQRFLKYN